MNTVIINECIKRNAHHKSQLADSFDGKVLCERGNITLEIVETCRGKELVLCDGWLSNWIIMYGNGGWGADNPINNKAFITLLDKIAS